MTNGRNKEAYKGAGSPRNGDKTKSLTIFVDSLPNQVARELRRRNTRFDFVRFPNETKANCNQGRRES